MSENDVRAGGQGAEDASDAALEREIQAALGDKSLDDVLDEHEAAAAGAKAAEAEGDAPADGLRRGKVVAVNGSDIFVDLGERSQGVLTAEQFPDDQQPAVGDTVDFLVDRYDEGEGLFILTRKGAAQKAAWATLRKGDVVEARVTGVNKGGLECDLQGLRAFMPASQADTVRTKDVSVFIGQALRCKVIELDRKNKNIVVSRRELLEEESKAAREQTMEELEVGQIREGTVKTIMPYGAFIDIGGVDGLVHVSDMSHQRVKDPADVVKPGETIRVKVLKIEQGGKRIGLGMKQLEASPWEKAAETYQRGQTVAARVVNLQKFGAFVEVEPGLEALIPISEMTWKKRINHPGEMLQAGQEVEVSVMEVDASRQRMSVSLKALENDPWVGAESRYAPGTAVTGTVKRLADFGAFIELEPGIEGLAHISELSDSHVERPSDVVRTGQQVETRILSVDEDARRVSLSMKSQEEATDYSAADATSSSSDVSAEEAERQAERRRNRPLKGGLD